MRKLTPVILLVALLAAGFLAWRQAGSSAAAPRAATVFLRGGRADRRPRGHRPRRGRPRRRPRGPAVVRRRPVGRVDPASASRRSRPR
jgi:hypothetical protein